MQGLGNVIIQASLRLKTGLFFYFEAVLSFKKILSYNYESVWTIFVGVCNPFESGKSWGITKIKQFDLLTENFDRDIRSLSPGVGGKGRENNGVRQNDSGKKLGSSCQWTLDKGIFSWRNSWGPTLRGASWNSEWSSQENTKTPAVFWKLLWKYANSSNWPLLLFKASKVFPF